MTHNQETDRKKLGTPFEKRLTTPETALSKIKPGDHIFVGSVCATPRALIQVLEALEGNLFDVELFHFLTDGAVGKKEGVFSTRFRHRVFFVGTDMREAVKQGQADYVPICISQVPHMINSGGMCVDVALIQTSLPDEHGFVSLGVSVDIAKAAVNKAGTVIAEINPNMPNTFGDSHIHIDQIDHMVMVETPVIEYIHPPADAVGEQIARYVARIIEDGSTLQVGLGRITNEMLKYLTNRKDLGFHSDVITEPIVDLIEKGVVTGKAKTVHREKIVCSYCMGTRRLYNLIDRNPMFSFHPIDYVCNPAILSAIPKFISVSQAFAVDLTGQVCTDQFKGEFYGGVSTQSEFLKGAANSPGGKPIICLSSTTEDGSESRIRSLLREGEGVSIPRSDVHYVVTEYGIAYLFGKTIRERTLSLIEIAHPNFREQLLDEAKELGYVREGQTLKSRVAYPAEEEREVTLKNGTKVLIRPSKASDVKELQEVFYDMSKEDIYTRFFSQLKSLSVSAAEHLCNVDYENEMSFMAIAGDRGKNHIVGSACYYLDPSTNLAEVAYMIRPEYQSVGLGGALQKRMMEYARERGLQGFTAYILKENKKMIRLASSGFSNVEIEKSFNEYEVTMFF
ncbi:GNAT family N-acetyltransferase [Desulfobacter vibrioformis]|uniref:GNAT family N-acetyltransferase n=1 Tax=Desulfobacter vibrioformis TaxID=34031 RepID=UPI0005575EDC|nr:GNAT family N-acetyltransferase [Desulfobacter vibrioformis]